MNAIGRYLGDRAVPRGIKVLLWLVAGVNLALLAWTLLSSFRSSRALWSDPLGADGLNLGGYARAWHAADFAGAFISTLLVTSASIVVLMALATPASYVLARSTRRSAAPLVTYFAAGLALPVQAVLIPYQTLAQGLSQFMNDWVTGWWDDRISLVICNVAVSMPFTVFVLTGYFRSLPSELEEAAALDGAGPARAFWKVMVPVARPGLSTVVVLNAIGLWNEFLLASVILRDPTKFTLPAALNQLNSTMQYSSDWGGLFAGVTILVAPMVVLFFWFGRKIMDGMTLGVTR
ncbi:carbohydrate ABC transporter membrane protein 2 (CUT1 family) [Streptomyces sp. 846.5]|nr:carbohydrate ABC transporter permease [Streptomyces sp. 846.5]TDU03467.1 carbohydrate ABC transporter membrane protein 2 (CUT1 family) [Streptomyces sp. 846.5]